MKMKENTSFSEKMIKDKIGGMTNEKVQFDAR